MSLRTRLALLAAFAIVALLVALFVAFRLARATETFAMRQADSSVRAAATELARDLQEHPAGYQNIEEAFTRPGNRPRENGPGKPDGRPRNLPPHVEEIFRASSDPLTRLTAVTLHRFPDVEGGFYRPADEAILGYASENNPRAGLNENIPSDLAAQIKAVAAQATSNGALSSRTIQVGNIRVTLIAYPPQAEGGNAAWAMQRLSYLSGASNWPNVAAVIILALSIIAVSALALITVRDLRGGVNGIESGLAELKTDLGHTVTATETSELARIATAINELAATLRANLARQSELEQQLAERERLSALGRVVAGVAHEVRNPLSAIKLKVQLADRPSFPPEKLTETFKVILAEIERLDSLVRRLLEVGRQGQMERRAVDLAEVTRSRALLFTDLAKRNGVDIKITTHASHVMVEGDANRLAQVADNLIQNAIEAMPEGGQLSISCAMVEEQPPCARVSFEDTGQGISPADQEHIFEPFHTGRESGTGLGLAIARAIVEEHGGNIRFTSRAGGGTCFVVELPLVSPDQNRDSAKKPVVS